jgi:shikimate dehydrogenase
MNPQIITGATRLVGLLGNPVVHSLSPLIHNHVFKTLGLPLAYVPLSVSSQGLHTALQAFRECNFAGANVTIPHKQAVLPYCDMLSPLSALTGTVNTLYFRNGLLHGTTTDWEGFMRALAFTGHTPKNGNIVILGNGGTARTFAFALASQAIPARLSIVGRDAGKVARLAAEVTQKTCFPVAAEMFSSGTLKKRIDECTLCINCTSVGMHPNTSESPLGAALMHSGMMVFDAIYNPVKTELCRMAEKAGCACQGGLRMLVYQGLASLGYWIGREINDDIIDMAELQAAVRKNAALPGADA